MYQYRCIINKYKKFILMNIFCLQYFRFPYNLYPKSADYSNLHDSISVLVSILLKSSLIS